MKQEKQGMKDQRPDDVAGQAMSSCQITGSCGSGGG